MNKGTSRCLALVGACCCLARLRLDACRDVSNIGQPEQLAPVQTGSVSTIGAAADRTRTAKCRGAGAARPRPTQRRSGD